MRAHFSGTPGTGSHANPGDQGGNGQSSQVETAMLRIDLDHDSGAMTGVVLSGKYTGRNLERMVLQELISLLQECRRDDEDSVLVLESYLDRIEENWRDHDHPSAAGSNASGMRDRWVLRSP